MAAFIRSGIPMSRSNLSLIAMRVQRSCERRRHKRIKAIQSQSLHASRLGMEELRRLLQRSVFSTCSLSRLVLVATLLWPLFARAQSDDEALKAIEAEIEAVRVRDR